MISPIVTFQILFTLCKKRFQLRMKRKVVWSNFVFLPHNLLAPHIPKTMWFHKGYVIFFSSLFKPFGLTRWGRIFSSDIFNSPWHTDLTHLLFFDQLQIDSDEFDDPILTLSQDDILSSIYNLGREEKKLKWCRLLKTAQVLPHTKRGRSKAVETAQRLWCKSCKFATSKVHPCGSKSKISKI